MIQVVLPQKVEYIIEKLMENGYEAYAVGGCIRDTILGRTPGDWDITTSARPEEVKAVFHHTHDTGISHGTVTVMLNHEGFEVTTYRIDGEYEDSRHPVCVEFTSRLEEDLKRRDFTINAMAYNPFSGLVDLFHGIDDIMKRQIRCVGNPAERFEEDALRMLRAVRFSGQLGFSIDRATQESIARKSGSLVNISAERIRTELTKLLMSDNPGCLRIAAITGITAVVLPELDAMFLQEQNNPHHIFSVGDHVIQTVDKLNRYVKLLEITEKDHSVLCWTMLLHDVGKPLCHTRDEEGLDHFYGHAEKGMYLAKKILRRLRFDNYTIELASRLIKWHDYRYTLTEKNMRRAVNKIGTDLMELLFIVQRMDVMGQNPGTWQNKLEILDGAQALYQNILDKGQCVTLKDLKVNGKDLLEAGILPGKAVGEALHELLDYVLDHPEDNKKEILLSRLNLK